MKKARDKHHAYRSPRAADGAVKTAQRLVLVAEPDPSAAKAIARAGRDSAWIPRVTTTLRAALAMASERFDALVVNLVLPDGSGFDVVTAVRARDPGVPALLIAPSPTSHDINRTYALRVHHVCKPYEPPVISDFLRRCEERDPHDARLATEVSEVASRHGLSSIHAELLLGAAMETSTLKALAERLGKSPSTVRAQAREIYRRLGAQTFEDVVAAIRARALRRR